MLDEFYAYTGIQNFMNIYHWVNEEQAQRLELLAGPHGFAIAKVIMLRRGVANE